MKNNDLSNSTGVTFAFRWEDCVEIPRKGVLKNIGKIEINKDVEALMFHIYRNTEYTVDIIIDKKAYTKKVKDFIYELGDFPFNRIVTVEKEVEIANRLHVGDISYYVDLDKNRLSEVNSIYAVDLDNAWKIARRGLK